MVDAEPDSASTASRRTSGSSAPADFEGVGIDAGRGDERREGVALLVSAPGIDRAGGDSQARDRLWSSVAILRLRRASDSSPLAAAMCGAFWTGNGFSRILRRNVSQL